MAASTFLLMCFFFILLFKWMLSQQLQGHKNAIHALASIHCHDKSREKDVTVLASSSADSTVIIWQKVDDPGTVFDYYSSELHPKRQQKGSFVKHNANFSVEKHILYPYCPIVFLDKKCSFSSALRATAPPPNKHQPRRTILLKRLERVQF